MHGSCATCADVRATLVAAGTAPDPRPLVRAALALLDAHAAACAVQGDAQDARGLRAL